MKTLSHARHGSISLLAAAVLAACGGGTEDDATAQSGSGRERALAVAAGAPKPVQAAPFPVGIALASPTALAPGFSESSSVGNFGTPASSALGYEIYSELKGGLLTAGTSVSVGELLEEGPADAGCYGPSILYAHHDDGPDATPARIPGDHLGLWLPEDGTGTPCAAAQMNARLRSATVNTTRGLLLAAKLVYLAQEARLALPARGKTLSLTARLHAALQATVSGTTVHTASITQERDRSWTYAINLTEGEGAAAHTVLYRLRHEPASSDARKFTGVLQYAVMGTTSDAALGCTDEVASAPGEQPLYKVSTAGTLRYDSSDKGKEELGAREARYCGHAPAGSTSLEAVAALTRDGELDPARALQGNTRGGVPGWRANFTRYGSVWNPGPRTTDGSYVLAWQARPQDSHSRMLAVRLDGAEAGGFIGAGYFAFGGPVAAKQPNLLGMICNVAGPGASPVPQRRFQTQFLYWPQDGLSWTVLPGGDRTAYAPTNSCSASLSMEFDLNADGVLDPREGGALQSALDAPRGNRSVAQELKARGLARPELF